MKVQFAGKLTVEKVTEKLTEVIEHTASKVMEENPDVKITGHGLAEADFTVKFNVEGIKEPQILTVEHHTGQPETFTWIVDVDKGELSNNEKESMFDEWTVAKAKGQDAKFKEIESYYNPLDLTELPELTEDYGDMAKKVYQHKEGFQVAKIFQDEKLVQEVKLIPKEEV